jgi:hypothetical protein
LVETLVTPDETGSKKTLTPEETGSIKLVLLKEQVQKYPYTRGDES